ncbi:hypothetical protein UFOVP844_62 [uncultured Caudovirales phage]|uniref:K1 capsule-specific polysaccharide lyase C-terminal domain-containing protein n=1 Tax=uncultured Caudovirales phage TaxID=2100421 RepID=A0A6J5PCL1_9CAUD|nr:hypothetical protein UFOVP844_62 [uncultured Caudovirales phage]
MSSPLSYLGTPQATTQIAGKMAISTVAECVAGLNNTKAVTPLGLAAVAIAGAPAASTSQAGIIEIATNTEAAAKVAGNLALVPSNIPSIMAEPGAIGGSTPAAGAFTSLSAIGGTVSLSSSVSGNLSATGAGIDMTVASDGGQVVINGEEAAANAIRLLSAAGGLDADVALQLNLTSSQNSATAVSINASAGGIEMIAAGAAAEDIVLTNTAGSIHLTAGEAAADAINIDSTGGFDLDAAEQINIASSQNAASAIVITASVGGIDILAAGASAGEDIDIVATGSSVNITSTENVSDAIYIRANAGTSEAIRIHADQGTGVASVNVLSDVGGITLRATGLASADAINLEAPAGGIDMDSALQTNIASSQAAATAVQVTASDSAGGITLTGGTGKVNVSGTHLAIATTGKGLQVKGGAATDMIGTATLSSGAATISNTNIATGDLIFLSRIAANGSTTFGILSYTISNGASFTITSLILGTPASTQTADTSTVAYMIVKPL